VRHNRAVTTSLPPILDWGEWRPLRGAGSDRALPTTSGLYRVRRADTGVIVYIGQTGRNLRERTSMLAGAYAAEMPYNDPHTAAPGLWALRHRDGCDFEVSTVPVLGDRPHILAMETLAITLQRVEVGSSPEINFGGMPPGYLKSSQNNARLVAAGKRFRGGPDPALPPPTPSVPVPGSLDEPPVHAEWLGLGWSPWRPANGPVAAGAVGLYRLRHVSAPSLVYIGQGQIAGRVRAHVAKGQQAGHAQQAWFAGPLELSWVDLSALPRRNLLEVENDLIASHVITQDQQPPAQFLG
jgi:hypothetical protein